MLLKKVFSIKSENCHKVINLLGFKIKFRKSDKYKSDKKRSYFKLFKNKNIQDNGENNKIITFDNSKLPDGISFSINGNNNTIYIDKSTNFRDSRIYIRSDNSIIKIYPTKYLVILDIEIKSGNNQELIIGKDFSSAEGCKIWMHEPNLKVSVGNDCMCSTDVHFIASDAHCIFDSDNTLINCSKGIAVGNHVWFGTHSRILKNVQIPDNTIVGANAVVTASSTDTGGGYILAGNPAEIVKRNIKWDRMAICNKKQEALINDN